MAISSKLRGKQVGNEIGSRMIGRFSSDQSAEKMKSQGFSREEVERRLKGNKD